MLSTILELLSSAAFGGIFGGLLRLAPEVLKIFTAKADRDHEYRMADLQLRAAQAGSEQRIREAEVSGGLAVDAQAMTAYTEALKAQGRRTGVWWADALSALVRPLTTYYFLALYGAYKAALMWAMLSGGAGVADAVIAGWTTWDAAMLAGLLNFWFVGRVFERGQARR